MSLEDFIITVFCLIDDELEKILHGHKLRIRGRKPGLTDSEVLTMEIVGEFLGIDRDKGIWSYFKTHWRHFFPDIPDRTNFVRQAANLHIVKRLLQEEMASSLNAYLDELHIIDGLPMPVCKFARALFSQVFKGNAAYGYCATKKERYYGFKGHLVVSSAGVVATATFAKANIDERDICPELTEKLIGLLLGDKGYIRPNLTELLDNRGIYLQTPLRDNMEDNRPKEFLKWLMSTRRLIETVIGQLTGKISHRKNKSTRYVASGFSILEKIVSSHRMCQSQY